MLAALFLPLALADGPRNTVSVDPLTAALGYPHVYFERALAPRLAVYGGPHLRLYDAPWSAVSEPYRGIGVEAGLRVFPWAKAPRGPWAAVRTVGALAFTTDGTELREPAGYLSVLGGYTAILADRWVLSGGLGVQYIDYTVGGYGVNGVFPAAHTALGVAF